MKVRHKRLWQDKRYEWNVLEESPAYYIVYRDNPDGTTYAIEKKDYEPVPIPDHTKEQWVDVTADCEADEYSNEVGRRFISIVYDGRRNVLAEPPEHLPGVYRIRKVELAKDNHGYAAKCWAFIVEKRQP